MSSDFSPWDNNGKFPPPPSCPRLDPLFMGLVRASRIFNEFVFAQIDEVERRIDQMEKRKEKGVEERELSVLEKMIVKNKVVFC